jgi:hypothetical protein
MRSQREIDEAIRHMRLSCLDALRKGAHMAALQSSILSGCLEWVSGKATPGANVFAQTITRLADFDRKEKAEQN